jgi:aminoglycoside adenylyltransferase-like protein/nucleotidyltransferase-like protein
VIPAGSPVHVYLNEVAAVCFSGVGGIRCESVVVHGSYAFGDQVPGVSDADVLVVADLADGGQASVAEAIEAVALPAEISGLELSCVSRADIADQRRARLFRLHCNYTHSSSRWVSGVEHAGDEDLTLHYEVARRHGFAIRGTKPADLFPPQAPASIARALVAELEWATGEGQPNYLVLNCARALAFVETGQMLSKIEGWLWARRHGLAAPMLDAAIVSFLQSASAGPSLDGSAAQISGLVDSVINRLRDTIRQTETAREQHP